MIASPANQMTRPRTTIHLTPGTTNTGTAAIDPQAAALASPVTRQSGASAESETKPSTRRARNRHRDERGFDRRNTGHGMLSAGKVASRWAVAWRHIKMRLIGKLPGSAFKTRLIRRLLGASIGENVGLAYDSYLDPYDPSLITIGDNVLIGYGTKIFVHAFTLTRQRVRPVTIGSNVMIGGFCVIAPGVTIGDGASIAPGTIVSRDVPAGAMAVSNTMQIRKRAADPAPAG